MSIVVCQLCIANRCFVVLMLNVYLTARRRALLGASGDQTALLSFSPLPGQTVAKLFGALVVALDALLFVSFLSSFFDVVFLSPLGASWGRI